MILNAFVEGLLLILLGIACYIAGGFMKLQPLLDTGALLVPLGVGYMGGTAVANKTNGGPK